MHTYKLAAIDTAQGGIFKTHEVLPFILDERCPGLAMQKSDFSRLYSVFQPALVKVML